MALRSLCTGCLLTLEALRMALPLAIVERQALPKSLNSAPAFRWSFHAPLPTQHLMQRKRTKMAKVLGGWKYPERGTWRLSQAARRENEEGRRADFYQLTGTYTMKPTSEEAES